MTDNKKEATVTQWYIHYMDFKDHKDIFILSGIVAEDKNRPHYVGDRVRSSEILEVNLAERYVITHNTKYHLR